MAVGFSNTPSPCINFPQSSLRIIITLYYLNVIEYLTQLMLFGIHFALNNSIFNKSNKGEENG